MSLLHSPNFHRTCITLVCSSRVLRVSPCFQTSLCLFGSILKGLGTLSLIVQVIQTTQGHKLKGFVLLCVCSLSHLLQDCYKVGPLPRQHVCLQRLLGIWFCQSFCCLGKNRKLFCAKICVIFSNLFYWEIYLKHSKIWEVEKKGEITFNWYLWQKNPPTKPS